MSGSVNKVILVGNLGKDPEIRNTQTGSRIATMSLATSETWKDKQSGERREKTEWHRVVVFDERLVDVISQYVHKGSKLYIEGTLQTRKWQDQSGQERYTTEVVLSRFNSVLTMLGKRGEEGGSTALPANKTDDGVGEEPDWNASSTVSGGGSSDIDDEIPF